MHACGHVLLFNQLKLALLIKVLSCYPAQMIFLLAAAFLRSAVSGACFLLVAPFTVFLFFLSEIPLTHIVDLSFEVNNIDSKLRRDNLLLVQFLSWCCRCVAEFPERGHYHLIWVRTRLHHAAKPIHPGGWMQRQARYFSPTSHMTTCDATALMFSLSRVSPTATSYWSTAMF